MKTYYKAILWFICSLLIFIATTYIRYQGTKLDLLTTPFIYFIAVLIALRVSPLPRRTILIAFLVGFLPLYVLLAVFEDFYLPYTLNITSYILAVFTALWVSSAKVFLKRTVLLLPLVAFCLTAYFLFFEQLGFLGAYGSLYGNTHKSMPANVGFITEQGDTVVPAQDDAGTIYVIDVWSTSCVNCFREFPRLQQMYDKYANRLDIIITALNIPTERDTVGEALQVIRNREYTFPVSARYRGIDDSLGINAYPVTLIIQNGTIIHHGNIASAENAMMKITAVK